MGKRIALTGIKPTGTPHIGNYLGAIKPSIALSNDYQSYYFIADYHALTTVKNGKTLTQLSYEVAATWLALGLDPERVVFYRQSDVPEIFELNWILSCFTPKGLLNRAHAYKAAVDQNIKQEKPEDEGINAGLYNYPVLMAADILMFKSNVVPVGLDQKQHVEIARNIAVAFNKNYSNIFILPEPLINEQVMTVPGLDGRKMSKNYNNVIPIFAPPKELRKRVMQIVTDSRLPEEPKDPETCNVFNMYRYFATEELQASMRERYLAGGLAYSVAKEELFALLDSAFSGYREQYNELIADTARLDRILLQGAAKAREIAIPMLEQVRKAIGVRPAPIYTA